jgi:pyridoxamine 5'-phosphate oxidase-like protein
MLDVVDKQVVTWRGFAAEAPTVAAVATELFERFGFVFVGTIRADGSPRISAAEVHLVDGHLAFVMVAGSCKARDLQRDRRMVIQTPVTEAANPGSEFKLRGVAQPADPALREAITKAVHAKSGWRPQPSWRFVDVGIHAASLLAWTPEAGDMILTRWDREQGLRATEQRRLDMQSSRYEAPR